MNNNILLIGYDLVSIAEEMKANGDLPKDTLIIGSHYAPYEEIT